MAYVLGYVYSDGSLEDAPYLRGKYLRISSKDKEILLKIQKVMGSEHNLQLRKPILIDYRNKTFTSKELFLLRIGDYSLFDDLINLGVTPRKSLSLSFPNIPHEYFNHFTRGFFDGDGSVFITTNNILKVVFDCVCVDYLQKLAEEISKNFKVAIRPVLKGHGDYQLRYYTKESLIILKNLYANCNELFLSRKYKIYSDYLNNSASCPSS